MEYRITRHVQLAPAAVAPRLSEIHTRSVPIAMRPRPGVALAIGLAVGALARWVLMATRWTITSVSLAVANL